MGASGKRGVDLAPLEVADWLSARDIREFDEYRSQWPISGRMVEDWKPQALVRVLREMGMGVAMAWQVFDALQSLPQTFVPLPARKQVSWQSFSSHNFESSQGQGGMAGPDAPRSGSYGTEQGLSASFGSDTRLVSLFQISAKVTALQLRGYSTAASRLPPVV